MRRYRIERNPLVESGAIQDYIAPLAGVDATLKIIRKIRRRIGDLAGLPNVGTVRNEIAPGLRALPAAEKATVCVTYAGQDWQQIAKSREQAP